jgi:GTP-binding protein
MVVKSVVNTQGDCDRRRPIWMAVVMMMMALFGVPTPAVTAAAKSVSSSSGSHSNNHDRSWSRWKRRNDAQQHHQHYTRQNLGFCGPFVCGADGGQRQRRLVSDTPPLPPSDSSTTSISFVLRAAAVPNDGRNKKNTNRTQQQPRRATTTSTSTTTATTTNRNNTNKRKTTSSTPAAAEQQLQLNKKTFPSNTASNKSVPPWNVRSPQEVKKHVQEEIERRENIKRESGSGSGMGDNDTIQNVASSSSSSSDSSAAATTPLLSKVFLSTMQSQFLKWKRFRPTDRIVGQRRIGTYFDPASLVQQLSPNCGVPEIAFIGRSNVGKSSLLNRLSWSRANSAGSSIGGGGSNSNSNSNAATTTAFARVGKTPGATASVNLYALTDRHQKDLIVFTDLPGFGYAKLSKERQESIIRTTEQYLTYRATRSKTLALGIVLIDIRRTPSDDDRTLIQTLYEMNIPILIVVTKIDKISSASQREQLVAAIQQELQLPQLPLCVSSITGENCNVLWQIILDACDTCVTQMKQRYEVVLPENDDALDHDKENDDVNDDERRYNEWYAEDKFVDADDIVYDQGYDWNNDDGSSLEYSDSIIRPEDDTNMDGEYNDDTATSQQEAVESNNNSPRETLKTLKKRVKKMQRRGEI